MGDDGEGWPSELPAVHWSTTDRASGAHGLAEVIATFGLLTVIFGVVHSGRTSAIPVAVAGYIGAAYWFTSSTSFANPAVTVARTLSDTFAGIAPTSAPLFISAQLACALLAVAAARVLFPEPEPEPHSRRPSMPDLDSLSPDQHLALRTAATDLHDEFEGTFGTETIELFLTTSYDQLAGRATVVRFLPLLAERFARQRLTALARVEGKATDVDTPIVLFLCVHNAGGNRHHRRTPQALDRRDRPRRRHRRHHGLRRRLPLFPGKRYEDWELDDPAGQSLEAVRPIRDEIRTRVQAVLADLGVPKNQPT